MTRRQLIELAGAAYVENFPESPLTDYVDEAGVPLEDMPTGDTLAAFIVRELDDTFDDGDDEDQLITAAVAIQDAIDDLHRVLDAIEDRRMAILNETPRPGGGAP